MSKTKMQNSLLRDWLGSQTMGKDISARSCGLMFQECVLEGRQYDHLSYNFYQGTTDTGEYIPLRKRVPTVQVGMCSVIVNDSTSLLFADSHFPAVKSVDKDLQQQVADIIQEIDLESIMLAAARMGAVGSVAIEAVIVDQELCVNLYSTKFLTPSWNSKNPKLLDRVVQQYKVTAEELNNSGLYRTKFEDGQYWFKSVWDTEAYTAYIPWNVCEDDDFLPKVDAELTTEHRLGIVPIVWIKNLISLCPTSVDGAPTCSLGAISIATELDYQLSQAGRALTYSADPVTVIKDGDGSIDEDGGSLVRTSDNIIKVDNKGDVKMLEIDGQASQAVIKYAECLRERFLELVRGNRTSPDKLAAATSGYAIELMNLNLVNLVKELRVSYGRQGILPLIKLIAKISEKVPFIVQDKEVKNLKISSPLKLQWPDFYDETDTDKQLRAATLNTLVEGGLLDEETGREQSGAMFGVDLQDAVDETFERTYRDPNALLPQAPVAGEAPKPGGNIPKKGVAGKPFKKS